MAKPHLIPKGSGKGEWSPNLNPRFPAHATISCPECGKASTMSTRIHSVTADGTVTPSYVCPHTPCPFHKYVRLADWVPVSKESQ